MKGSLREQIIQANIDVHKEEAKMYDVLVPEIFCKHEQGVITQILDLAIKKIGRDKIKVLDVGAGTGNISLKLNTRNEVSEITAVDLSQEMIDRLNGKMKGSSKVRTIIKDVDSFLEDDPSTYDLIVISSVLHHLPDYLATTEVLRERLKPNGVICIFHEPSGEKSKVINMLEWLDSRIFVNFILPKKFVAKAKELDYSWSDFHVYHDFKMKELKEEFEQEDGIEVIYFLRHNVFKLGIFRFLGKFIPTKNNFILAVQKK